MITDSYNNMNYDRVSDSLSKSELSINPGISELFFCINYFTSKFIITEVVKYLFSMSDIFASNVVMRHMVFFMVSTSLAPL